MIKRTLVLPAIGFAMFSATAIAQTTAPAPAPAARPAAPAVTTAPAAAPEQNLAGQGKWRASKLMGVDIYGADNTKIGDVTEVLFDKNGKVEMVTVGVGGFLGIGAKDVAIPFDQVTWSDQPMQSTTAAAPATGAAPGTTGATGMQTTMPSASTTASAPAMYPDHGKVAMTKEQLSSAPAVTYSGR